MLAHIKSWKTNPMPSWCLSIFYWLLWSDSLFHGSTRYFIQYNSVWFDWAAVPSLLTLWVRPRLLQPHCVVVPLRWHLDHYLSPSPSSCCLHVFVPLFSLSALSPHPHGSPRLSTALSLSLTLSSSISQLLSGVSVSARQGVPGVTLRGNELLITSQETRHSTPTPPPSPHPMKHTRTKKNKKPTQLSYAQPTKRNSIGEAGQRGRGADEKSLEKLLQALINNHQTSKIK